MEFILNKEDNQAAHHRRMTKMTVDLQSVYGHCCVLLKGKSYTLSLEHSQTGKTVDMVKFTAQYRHQK